MARHAMGIRSEMPGKGYYATALPLALSLPTEAAISVATARDFEAHRFCQAFADECGLFQQWCPLNAAPSSSSM